MLQDLPENNHLVVVPEEITVWERSLNIQSGIVVVLSFAPVILNGLLVNVKTIQERACFPKLTVKQLAGRNPFYSERSIRKAKVQYALVKCCLFDKTHPVTGA